MSNLSLHLGENYKPSISRLKKLQGRFYNPEAFLISKGKESQATIRGNLVEDILNPNLNYEASNNVEFLKSRGYMKLPSDIATPSKGLLEVIDELINLFPGTAFSNLPDYAFLDAASIVDYGKGKYSWETIKNKLDPYREYIDLMSKAEEDSLTVITHDTWVDVQLLAHSIFTDYNTKLQALLANPMAEWQKYIEFHVIDDVYGKGILDFFLEEQDRIIIFDIKTTELSIGQAIYRNRWDLQLAYYKLGVEKICGTDKPVTVANVVLSTQHLKPVIIEYSEDDLLVGLTGRGSTEGVYNLIDKFKYHRDTDDWQTPFSPNETFELGLEGSVKANLWI